MKLQHLVATGILAIATAGAGYYAYSHLLHPPLVTTSFASLAAVSEAVYGTGTVEPERWAKVVPLQRRRLVELCKCEGQVVKAGQILGRQDDAEERSALEQMDINRGQLERDLARSEKDRDKNDATRTEYEYAHAPDWFAAGGYVQADFNKPGIDWVLLDDTDDGYDLYGDGVIRMWQTPGHAPGHQSFEITLPNSGSILLTVDAAYTTDHWEEKALPGFLADVVATVRSVRKLHRIAARSDSTVVTGHDPDAWPKFKHAPEFYD